VDLATPSSPPAGGSVVEKEKPKPKDRGEGQRAESIGRRVEYRTSNIEHRILNIETVSYVSILNLCSYVFKKTEEG
jgi:hypothetical protein